MRTTRQQGFTIIEVLVAILVVGLAATATAMGMRATTNHLGSNQLHARAIALTQSAVEDLRTVAYADMASSTSTTNDGFQTVLNVVEDSPAEAMKMVTATTTWNWRGIPQTYKIDTVYSQVTPN